MLGPRCRTGFSLVMARGGSSLVAVPELLTVGAALVVEGGLQGTQASLAAALGLESTGPIAVAAGLNCPAT